MTLTRQQRLEKCGLGLPALAFDDERLFTRLNAARRLWLKNRHPNNLAELDRLLDEMNRRRRKL